MTMFKDKGGRYVFLRPDHVSAISEGGNGFAIVHLRGGQTVAVQGEVTDVWQQMSRTTLDKPEASS